MAVYVQAINTEWLEHFVPLATAVPLSMACWFQTHSTIPNSTLMGLFDKDVTNHGFVLQAAGDSEDDKVRCFTIAGGAFGTVASTSSWTVNTWHHACAVFASSTDRRIFLDGGSKATEATDVTPAGIDLLSLGRSGDSTPTNYLKGYLAEVGVWTEALTDVEVAILANGTPPDRVRRQNLVHYYRLRNIDELKCRLGSAQLIPRQTPTSASHCRIFYPPAPMPFRPPLVVIWLESGQRWLYTAANWAARSWYLEATFRSLAGGATSRVKLYDLTAAADVASSEVTSMSATISRQRSSALSLVDGHEYEVQFGSGGGFSAAGRGARLLGVH